MNVAKCILLFFVSLFCLTACFEVKPIEIGEIKGVKVTSVANGAANVEFKINLINPNDFKVSIVDADVAIEVNGVSMGKIDEIKKITLPANSNDTYLIPLSVNLNSLLSNPLQLISFFAKSQATVKVTGWVKGQAKGISKKVDVDVTQNTALFK